jgi:hypothetical protein
MNRKLHASTHVDAVDMSQPYEASTVSSFQRVSTVPADGFDRCKGLTTQMQ